MIIDLEASKEATHGLGKRSEEEASKEPYHTLQHILEFRNPKNVFLRPILLSFSPIQFRILILIPPNEKLNLSIISHKSFYRDKIVNYMKFRNVCIDKIRSLYP